MRLLFISFMILAALTSNGQSVWLSGTMREATTGRPIPAASILFSGYDFGTKTDSLGQFKLAVKARTYQLIVRAVGYKSFTQRVEATKAVHLEIELREWANELEEVVITTEKEDAPITRAGMGVERIAGKALKKLPSLLGEADVMRSLLMLPGVSTVGEGASGFQVRGGNTDQNLVLLDGVPLFNTSHLFGFFTAFNADLVQETSLYKGNVPAQFGGRASAVVDVRLKEANFEKFHAQAGIGPLAARLTLDTPLWKGKTSLLLGSRVSLSDFFLKYLEVGQSRANFYDVNARLTHQINPRNRLTLSAYQSADRFRFGTDTTYFWQSKFVTFKYSSLITNKLSSNFSVYSNWYDYGTEGLSKSYQFRWQPRVRQSNVRQEFLYNPSAKSQWVAGGEWTRHRIHAGNFEPLETASSLNLLTLPTEHAQEWALFLNHTYTKEKWRVDYGLRWVHFGLQGPYEFFNFTDNTPRSVYSLQDTTFYLAKQPVKAYNGIEPRFSINYVFSPKLSVKASYTKMQQFIHLLSNTMAISPADVWKLSDPYVPPQVTHQVSLGSFYQWKDYRQYAYDVSLELYYKHLPQLVDYIDGANLYLNPLINTELVIGKGRSYGAELMLRKPRGRWLTGWVSYVYARSFRQVEATATQLSANRGKEFPANFDSPHNLKLVLNQRLGGRVSFNTNFTYATGRPITFPNGRYKLYAFSDSYDYLRQSGLLPRIGLVQREWTSPNGSIQRYTTNGQIEERLDGYSTPSFTLRNAERLPDYVRLDMGLSIDSNPKKRFKSSWNISVYNLLGRRNVYSVFFRSSVGLRNQAKAYKLSVLGAAVPSLTYNLSF